MSSLRPLVVSTFPNAKALPLWAGVEAGIFARHRLALSLDETESSSAQRAKLAAGDVDIVQSAVDNALALRLAGHDILIVMGGESGMNDFMVRADISDFADFKGRTLVVDAPNTAYALLARKLLGGAGLVADQDYKIVSIGNGARRLRALLDSDAYDGAVMNPPFSSEASLHGLKSLGRLIDLLGPYQAGGTFLLRSFAQNHPDRVEAYIAAYVEALAYVTDPTNANAMIAMLDTRLKLSPGVAKITYSQIVDPAFGFTPAAKLDLDGIRNMLAIRSETEGPDPRLEDLSAFIDESFYRRVVSGISAQD